MLPRIEPYLIAGAALLIAFLPLVPELSFAAEAPRTPADWVVVALTAVAALALLGWRRWPLGTLMVGVATMLVSGLFDYEPSDLVVLLLPAYAFVAAERFTGKAAWLAGLGTAAWLQAMYIQSGDTGPALLVFAVPGFVAGVAVRLRRETNEHLELRSRELEEERELFAEVSVRNERARVAAELHDLIGHALSVMVVQSAAGQRLVDRDPEGAAAALDAIAASARQGRKDLRRLLDLLGGEEVATPDLSLIDELVARAAASGLAVTCRFEGDRDGIPAPLASVAFRVVQESLTNALRYAPGAVVRVLLRGEGRRLSVVVENDAPTGTATGLQGGGTGLAGLRDRVQEVGGTLSYGVRAGGGWGVEAALGR